MIEFKVGDTIEFSCGEYDDFRTDGVFEVLHEFSDEIAIIMFKDLKDEDWRWRELPEFLVEVGYIKEIQPTHKWYWKDYDGIHPCRQ